MELEEITEFYRTYNWLNIKYDLGIDVQTLYQKLYDHHKLLYGSFRKYVNCSESYPRMMEERYNDIYNCMNEIFENKISKIRK